MKSIGISQRGPARLCFSCGLILISACLVFSGAGCVSSAKAALLSQSDPIALVSVVSNYDINWVDEEPMDPNTDIISPLTTRVLRTDPDLAIYTRVDDLIDKAEVIFRDVMAESGIIKLADKNTVLNSRAYQNAALNRNQIYNKMVCPDSFRLIDYRNKSFSSALLAETGIQRSMFLEFSFTKAPVNAVGKNGSCRAEVEMIVFVLDSRGKTLFRKTYFLWSSSLIKVSNGAYSQSGLIELCEATIKDVCDEFIIQLKK